MGITYKPPTQKIPMSSYLVLFGICSRHNLGNGAAKRMKSVRTFMPARTIKQTFKSMHFAFTVVSQAALIGIHWKMATKIIMLL